MTYQLTWWTKDEYPEFPNVQSYESYEELVSDMGELDAFDSVISLVVPVSNASVEDDEKAWYFDNLIRLMPSEMSPQELMATFFTIVLHYMKPSEAARLFEMSSELCGQMDNSGKPN